jgi:hypothetical protein
MKHAKETNRSMEPGTIPEIDLSEVKRDICGEAAGSQREFILGDDDLMFYCLYVAAQLAIKKGDDACRALLEHCNCELEESLQAACSNNPKAMVKELLRLTFDWYA